MRTRSEAAALAARAAIPAGAVFAALAAALALVAALAVVAGPAAAADEAPGGPASPAALGEVRGDTLWVDPDKVTAAALRNNDMLAAAAAGADAAAGDALAAWAGFLPRISAGEYFFRTDNALNNFGYLLNRRVVTQMDFDPARLNDPGPGQIANTQLRIEQPVFNAGMSLYGKRAANAASAAARLKHDRARDEISLAAIQAYNGLALARAYEQVVLQAIAAAEGHARRARAMLEADMATPADHLQAEVHLSGLRQRLIEVRNQAAVAGENIELLTGIDTELALAPAVPLARPRESEPALADLRPYARRPDVLASRKEAEAATGMARVARGRLLPHVNLGAEKNWWSEEPFRSDADSWTFAVYGTWNLFDFKEFGGLKRARAEARAARYMADFQRRQARVEATEAWLGLEAAREKVQVAESAVEAAREGLRILTNQYGEGLASMVDLLDTQTAATQAEADLVQALHDYNVSLARLRTTGAPVSGEEPR